MQTMTYDRPFQKEDQTDDCSYYEDALRFVEQRILSKPLADWNADALYFSFLVALALMVKAPSSGDSLFRREKIVYIRDPDYIYPSDFVSWLTYCRPQHAVALGRILAARGPGAKLADLLEERDLPAYEKAFLFALFEPRLSPDEILPFLRRYFCEIQRRCHAGEDPIATAAYAHMELVKQRPFAAGNGRLARLIMNVVLYQANLPAVAFGKFKAYTALQKADHLERGAFEAYLRRSIAQATEIGKTAFLLLHPIFMEKV